MDQTFRGLFAASSLLADSCILPGKAWFAYFRFYGPTEGYFQRTYALPGFEGIRQ
ncbi:hypothetical protein ACIQUS_09005 [Pseudomonas sp. NPDC090755]|uniref:hypothetical protein n=1 Tax=Pseudomonas sp. NPDC090755 TaxID=3364481 RepID=UPI00383BBBD3